MSAQKGDRVIARRYEQPTLTSGDPRRVLLAEWTGTVNEFGGMLTDDGSYVSFGYVFLGGSPQLGTCAYAVTEVEMLSDPGRLA
jgi:hypothetical protein